MRILTRLLSNFWSYLTHIVFSIVSAGTKDVPAERARKIIIVNKLSFATLALAAPIGTMFYFTTGYKEIFYPALIEAALFGGVITLNALRRHAAASIAVLLVHCCGALYFSALLGPVINITPILVFMFGLCFLVYPQRRLRIIGVCATVVTLALTEANLHFQFLPRLHMSEHSQLIMSAVSIPSFLVFVFLVFYGFYKQNLKLLERLKLYVGYFGHELRNTVSSSTFIVAQLEEEIQNDERYKDLRPLLRELKVADNQILSICENALNIGEIEAGSEKPLNSEPIPTRRFFRERTFLHRKRADQRRMKLSLQVDEGLPESVSLDASRMTQILNNLITNAIKYGDMDSTIRVEVRKLDAKLMEVAVCNSCPDVPPEKLKQLFDMYVTAKRDSNIQGSGLGLYIVKNLVGIMGGTIAVSSENHTTTFKVTLPITEATFIDRKSSPQERAKVTGERYIMIVDDDRMAVRHLQNIFSGAGWKTIVAFDGAEMLQMLSKADRLPALILLDLNMPGMSGDVALRLLKENELFKGINVVVCTGTMEDHAELKAKVIAAGAVDAQPKPLAKQVVLNIAENL